MPDDINAADADGAPLDLSTRWLICLGGLPGSLAMTAIGSVLPRIDTALAHSATDSMLVKQLIGAVGLAMIVGSSFGGFLVGRLGLRAMLVGAAVLYVVAGTAGLYLSSLPMLLASRLVVGLAAAAIQVAVLTLINGTLSGQQRARWMGIHISLAMAITIAIHPLAGMLGERGWRMPFLLYLIGLVIIPAAFWLVERTPIRPRADTRFDPDARDLQFIAWFPFRYLALGLCTGTVMFMMTIYGPFMMRHVGIDSPRTIAWVLTADSIAGAAMALLYGRFRRRFSARSAFGVSFLAAATGALLVGSATGFVGIFIGLLVFGLGGGWLIPNLLTALAEQLEPSQQGRAAGLVKASHFAAAPIGVLITAPIAAAFGLEGVMFGVAGLACAAALLTGPGGLATARAARPIRTMAPT